MRTYRAAIPEVRHSAISQPPLVGSGWPKVIGKHISEIDPDGGRLLGPVAGSLTGVATFQVLSVSTVLFYLLGAHWRPFYFLAALTGAGAAWKAFSQFNGGKRGQ